MKTEPIITPLRRLAPYVLCAAVAACGGGGSDAGTSPFTNTGSGTGTTTGTGTETTPPSGGSTAGGGISNVSTGQPNQRSMSLSVEKYALDWSKDGDTTSVTVRVTDTAGNPVPDGTSVQFSSQGGQIQTSCKLTGVTQGSTTISQCSVTFATQNQRPLSGYVAILAWLEGDEAYIDLDGNGAYTAGEPFYDTGRLFRDDDLSSTYTPSVDELNLGSTVAGSPGIGTQSCGAKPGSGAAVTETTFGFRGVDIPTSVDNTCDGVWGRTLVRARTYLPVSDPRFLGIQAAAGGVETFSLWSGDMSKTATAPAGTTVSVVSAPANCTFVVSPSTVAVNDNRPVTFHRLTPSVSGTCASGTVTVKASFGANEATVTANLPL